MRKLAVVCFLSALLVSAAQGAAASPEDDGSAEYDSITSTADFNYRPAYVDAGFKPNFLFQDVAVSAVEAVPFGFILGFIGIYAFEALSQSTIQPVLGSIEKYTPVYASVIGGLAVLNIGYNTLFFYDYGSGGQDAKKSAPAAARTEAEEKSEK